MFSSSPLLILQSRCCVWSFMQEKLRVWRGSNHFSHRLVVCRYWKQHSPSSNTSGSDSRAWLT